MSDVISADEGAVKRRIERSMELAALFKEVNHGSMKKASVILAKFRLQEGVSKVKSKAYFDDLVEAGLVRISKGQKRWRYNVHAEWDLFMVTI